MTTCTPRAAWGNLLRRLHFYVGLFVGPFIFFAALTGTLYVATPQLENTLYRHALHTDSVGEARPLAEQIAVAEKPWVQICVCMPFVRGWLTVILPA